MDMESSPMVERLMAVISERRDHPPAERSYVVTLLKAGTPKICSKIIEEAGEVVEASSEVGVEGRAHLIHEVADLLFHTLVLLGEKRIEWHEIEAELGRRFGVSGIVEKESRHKSP